MRVQRVEEGHVLSIYYEAVRSAYGAQVTCLMSHLLQVYEPPGQGVTCKKKVKIMADAPSPAGHAGHSPALHMYVSPPLKPESSQLSCKISFCTRPRLIFLPNDHCSSCTRPTIFTMPCQALPYTAAYSSGHLLPCCPSHADPCPPLLQHPQSSSFKILGRLGRILDLSQSLSLSLSPQAKKARWNTTHLPPAIYHIATSASPTQASNPRKLAKPAYKPTHSRLTDLQTYSPAISWDPGHIPTDSKPCAHSPTQKYPNQDPCCLNPNTF
jgi:hypothetical protein